MLVYETDRALPLRGVPAFSASWSKTYFSGHCSIHELPVVLPQFKQLIFQSLSTLAACNWPWHHSISQDKQYGQLSPCGHLGAITDTPIMRQQLNPRQKYITNVWPKEIPATYYGLSILRTLTRGPEGVRNKGSWLYSGYQAPVVQKAGNYIQRINHYPADKMYSNQYILSAG